MDIHEVVKKLIGPIDPVGETNTDNNRFKNLEAMTELVDALLRDIDVVTVDNLGRPEHSRNKAGEFASKFFDRIGITNE